MFKCPRQHGRDAPGPKLSDGQKFARSQVGLKEQEALQQAALDGEQNPKATAPGEDESLWYQQSWEHGVNGILVRSSWWVNGNNPDEKHPCDSKGKLTDGEVFEPVDSWETRTEEDDLPTLSMRARGRRGMGRSAPSTRDDIGFRWREQPSH